MATLNMFDSKVQLEQQLAENIAQQLAQAIKTNDRASLAVSGGSTPKALFALLSEQDIPWSKVTITLADERWVEETDGASNSQLIRQHLLVNKAKAAHFFPLKVADKLDLATLEQLNHQAELQLLPFDVVVLGMGEDGHTASIFPCSEQIDQALDVEQPLTLIKVVPKTAPHERISFTYRALAASKHIYLHITGLSKQEVLKQALSQSDKAAVRQMPIRAFLNNDSLNTQVYWAE
jgi:6-phosphogluconolactonase